jgi:hypothetical protein
LARGDGLLQAKRLSADIAQKKLAKIQHREFRELRHKPASKAAFQYQTLASGLPPWIPRDMFYNHADFRTNRR